MYFIFLSNFKIASHTMKNSFFYSLILLLLFVMLKAPAHAQIINGTDTLYGNEWINFNQSYFKIMLAEDGIYRIPFQALSDAGVPVNSVPGAQFQLFHNGEEIPLHISNDGTFGTADYLEFFGKKNTSELDKHLFKDAEAEMMNPYFSLITDTAAYFLTWTTNLSPLRYQTIANDMTNLPPKEEYGWYDLTQVFTGGFDKKRNGEGVRNSYFDISEGYSSGYAQTQNINITPIQPFIGNQNAMLSLRYACGLGQHNQAIKINGQQAVADQFNDFQVKSHSLEIANASLSSQIQVTFEGMASNNDKQRVAFISLRYPRLLDAQNQAYFTFSIGASAEEKYLEIAGFNAGTAPVIYDLTNRLRLLPTIEGNFLKIALPPSNMERQLVLVNQDVAIKTVNSLKPVQFINYLQNEGNYVIISNRKLFDDGNGVNWVQEYADYRGSTAGGSYSPVVVEIQQLYDQFAWGIQRHPLAVRDFALFVKKQWQAPKYVLLLGKGREYTAIRAEAQLAAATTFYLPTFGVPGSDNLMLAGTDGFTPVLAVGRIAASTPKDIQVYLNKVKEFEANQNLPQTIADRAWMKRILNLGGGNGAILSEQALIRSYLENMADILENGKMGASARGFYKTSADPIQQPQTEDLFNYINEGTSIITFFGHSAVGVFDFSIDFPENYKNKGKYPLMVSLGCYAGNIHTSERSLGERFVFLEDAGPILFIATAGQGYISSLNTFTVKMYTELGGDSYGKGVGDILQKTISIFQGNDFGVNLIRQQFNFLGDPALSLNPSPGPDFLVDESTVKFSPNQVNANQEKFQLSFDVVNIGQKTSDSIQLTVVQELPDASRQTVVDTLIPAPGNRATLIFEIPVSGKKSVGLNRFYIKADASDQVLELPLPQAETNNELVMSNGEKGATLFIRDNSAMPAYPPDFGIVTSPDFTLKAYTTDPLAPSRKYLLQLDTTENFNSSMLTFTEVVQSGGVIHWKPAVTWSDETVYYWRISPDSVSANEGYNWNGSSFLFKNDGQEGWNQSHFYQFLKDDLVNLELKEHEQMKFLQNFKDFRLRNAPLNILRSELLINNATRAFYYFTPPAGIYIVLIDSVFLEPYWNYYPGNGPISYGLPHPWGIDSHSFMFDSSADGRKQTMDFLTDVAKENETVILFTVQNHSSTSFHPEEWAADSILYGKNLFNILETDGGAQLVRQLETTGSLPYAVAYKKGGGLIDEAIASTPDEIIELFFSLAGNWNRGYINSPLIGTASAWGKFSWKTSGDANPQTDTVSFDILGSKGERTEQDLLFELISAQEFDLSTVNASEYPYLRLRFNSEDSIFLSSANLDHWRVTFDGAPEFAFDPNGFFQSNKDTVQTGEPFRLSYAVENMSVNDGDSLLVKYRILDGENKENLVVKRLPVVSANDSLVAQLTFDTRTSSGKQNLTIELNPDNDQLENIHSNNFLQTNFYVEGDQRNPILDVTFDGMQIIDGAIVSPNPVIRIVLKDENKFLLLDDTSQFKLFLLYPDSAQLVNVPFNSPDVNFIPASTGNNNTAAIEFQPVFKVDGRYALIIQARDVSGNAAGKYDLKRYFQVITKSSISNVLNYPNPFSTATRFVYTLTGSEITSNYKLQIMTVTGRIVREVSRQEMGELKAGTHQTDFVWDGTDEFGDRLANGVYLYRFFVEDENGKAWDNFETGADSFFKEGFGKMVLIR